MPDPNVIEFECPRCLGQVRVPKDQAGKRIDCPICQGSLLVPNQSTSQDLFDDIFESASAPPPQNVDTPSDPDVPNDAPPTEPPASEPVVDGPADSADDLQLAPIEDSVTPVPESTDGPSKASQEPDAESSDVSPDDEIDEDDLLDGLVALPDEPESPSAPLEGQDPFEVDPNAPLKVDGIGDFYSDGDVFGIKCKVCDTRIHVRTDQIESQIECPECFTKILVTPPTEEKPTQKWVKDGRGVFTQEKKNPDDEIQLSPPVDPPDDVDESYGLAPVTDDLLAPKPKSSELEQDISPDLETESGLQLEPLLDRDPLEDPFLSLDDEIPLTANPTPASASENVYEPKGSEPKGSEPKGSEPKGSEPKGRTVQTSVPVPAQSSPPPSPAKPQQHPNKSRRELYEESLKRQDAADAAASFGKGDVAAEDKEFPAFDFGSLASAVKDMVFQPGVLMRASIAIALMCVGAILGELIAPSVAPELKDGESAPTFFQRLMQYCQWGLFGAAPYLVGLMGLWFTSSYLFREAALGQRKVRSWKNSGIAEIKGTFLLFSFGFFIGGFFMPPFTPFVYLILPFRFLLGTLFLLGAWHNQSAFGIINVDAFKNFSKLRSQWMKYYTFIFALAAIALIGGLFYWMRGVVPIAAGRAFLTVLGVLLTASTTLAFAAICGWHCGSVSQDLEKSE